MSRRIAGLFAGVSVGLAALAGAAVAQPGPEPGPGLPPGREHPQFDPQEHARKLADLLQLRPNQQPALAAYVSALAPPAERRMGGEDRARPATTPERLARMEQMMTEHQAAMHARIEATRRFYDQLDPAQKRAFDALGPMMMGHGRMGQGRMMQMHRWGGPDRDHRGGDEDRPR